MGIFTTCHKIRANSVNWEAKVLLSPVGAWILKGRAVLGITMETGNGMDPGVILATTNIKHPARKKNSEKNFQTARNFFLSSLSNSMREEKFTPGCFDLAIIFSKKFFTIYFPHSTAFISHMTANPIFPESRRRLVCVTVALMLLVVAVLLAAGCSDGKTVQEPDNETVRISLVSTIATTAVHSDIAEINNSITPNPVRRNISCPYSPYEPVFLLGDNHTTRILGHETKSVSSSRTFCTEFDTSTYTLSFNVIPSHVMKFDFAEFDQTRIISKIRQDQEIDVWIRGEKYKALLKDMNFNAEDTGAHSYSGVLDGISRSRVVITLSKNFTSGSVRRGDDTFYFSPVGIKKDEAGSTIPVNFIYDQKDVENYSFSLANDVITPSIPVKHYE
jgi:hypothetical protein